MAVSNQEVAAWLAANPTATDAQIAQAALAAGISSQQLAQVTGIPVEQVESRITAVLPSLNPTVEQRWQDLGEAMVPQYFVAGTNIPVDQPSFMESNAQSDVFGSTRTPNNITIYDPVKKGEYVYSPTGQYLGFKEGARDSSLLGAIKEITKETAPIWTAALAANAGSLFGDMGAGVSAADLANAGATTGAATGALSAAAPAAATTAANAAATGLTAAQVANLAKAGLTVAGLAGATKALQPSTQTSTPMQTPAQGMPAYSPDYYNQLQQYYNAYLPQTPRDVVSPLQQWYNS